MSTKILRGLLGLLVGMVFTATSVSAQERIAPAPDAIDTYLKLRKQWIDHLQESPPILEIINAKAASEEVRLNSRLESLQRKKVSNREWYDYWANQKKLSNELIGVLKTLTPLDLDTLERQFGSQLQALQEAQGRPKIIIAGRISQARIDIEKIITTNTQVDAKLSKVRKTLEQLALTATRLEDQKKSPAKVKNRLKLDLAIADAEKQIQSLNTEYRMNETALLKKETLLAALSKNPASIDPASLENDTELAQAISQFKKTAQFDYSGEIKNLNRKREWTQRLKKVSIAERSFLKHWSTLATDKTESQNTYLEAIDAEISAITRRLKNMPVQAKQSADEELSKDHCRPSIIATLSPFEKHRACVHQLKLELEQLAAQEENTNEDVTMNTTLMKSSAALLKAQTKDSLLAKREREYASEANAIDLAGKEWKALWAQYQEQAETKQKDLDAALHTTKVRQRELKARQAILESAQKRNRDNLDSHRAKLEENKALTASLKAVLASALKIIQVGWLALVYILAALFLIRLVRNFRDRKMSASQNLDQSDVQEEIKSLEAELRRAEETKNEARAIELHEEIGRIENQIKDQGQRIETVARVAAQAVTLVIWVATILLVLDALTVDIAPILGGAAIFGLAISFGSQSLVKDVVSGFFILLENQYAVGDVVTINGQTGGVEKITLRRTVLRSGRGEVHNFTNGSISSVTNMTQGWARVIMELGVGYGSDIEHVKSVINEVGEVMYADEEWRSKLTEKPSFVGVTRFGESDIGVRVWVKTKTFQNWAVERELNLRIKTAFEAAGIEIPFPKRDINVVIQGKESTLQS